MFGLSEKFRSWYLCFHKHFNHGIERRNKFNTRLECEIWFSTTARNNRSNLTCYTSSPWNNRNMGMYVGLKSIIRYARGQCYWALRPKMIAFFPTVSVETFVPLFLRMSTAIRNLTKKRTIDRAIFLYCYRYTQFRRSYDRQHGSTRGSK